MSFEGTAAAAAEQCAPYAVGHISRPRPRPKAGGARAPYAVRHIRRRRPARARCRRAGGPCALYLRRAGGPPRRRTVRALLRQPHPSPPPPP